MTILINRAISRIYDGFEEFVPAFNKICLKIVFLKIKVAFYIKFCIIQIMKGIIWLGSTHQIVKEYPINVRREIGYNLDKVQRGLDPCDWKPMVAVGNGVKEIRIHEENEYRVLYVAKFEEAIYVLHSFVKKTQQTAKKDIDMARKRYAEILEKRRVLA